MQFKEFIELMEQEELSDSKHSSADQSRLSDFCSRHIAKVVALQLLASDLDVHKWHALIFGFI